MAKITGTLLDETIVGNYDDGKFKGKDTLDGAAGNDVLYGYGDGSGIGGTPPPYSPDSGGPTDSDILIGGLGNDTLFGGGGNDKLDGGLGVDSMDGGDQDDIYYVDNKTDVAAESNADAFGGTDLVICTAVEYTLGSGIENLTLVGKDAIAGTGNALSNAMVGSAVDNVLNGDAGNDTLDGGAGADALTGGLGDDTYVLDNAGDLIFESAGLGTDTIRWMRNASLDLNAFSSIENGVLLGGASINLTGTAGNNGLAGNAGANVIDGGGGFDIMAGGGGNDTYIIGAGGGIVYEAAGGGTDHVISGANYDLSGQAIENLTLTGTAIQGIGNELANIIRGNDMNNVIAGEGGADKMIGGKGDDSYSVDNVGDKVIELDNEGFDTIFSMISLTLPVTVEALRLEGTANINATGTASSDELYGNSGNNKIDGKAGADTMDGGEGSDTMMVDNIGDVTSDTGLGDVDLVFASVDHTIGAGIENLTLSGKAVQGIGNDLGNRIVGNAAGNLLYGNAGFDTLDGGAGADVMDGGDNPDTYYVDNVGDQIEDTGSTAIASSDFVNSSVTFTLHASLENLRLLGAAAINGTGNAANNLMEGNKGANKLLGLDGIDQLIGNAGNDTLDGGANDGSADTLTGGAGNDVYFVGTDDVVVEDLAGTAGGIDTVISNEALFGFTGDNIENLILVGTTKFAFGNDLNNVITGNDVNNGIDGGGGADTMSGGGGDDTYSVNVAGDIVKESSGGGHDTVSSRISYTLGAEVEDLTFVMVPLQNYKGTGNGLDNKITGAEGDDTLNGMGGADTLNGGDGNDALNGADGADTLNGGAGNDALNGAGGDDALNGGADNDALNGADGADTLNGDAGNDTLNGGGGADSLFGGDGNDTLIVDNIGDVTSDDLGFSDTALSSVSHTIGTGVDDLTLTGKANIDGTGNDLNNNIDGNSGANKLFGLDGHDRLIGGAGNDSLVGGDGQDLLIGGAGLDTLDGGVGSDTYMFDKSSSGKDTISNLELGAGGDVLDLHQILVGYAEGVSNPNDFVRISFVNGDMVLQVDANGLAGGSKFADVAVLASYPNTTVDELVAGGNLFLSSI